MTTTSRDQFAEDNRHRGPFPYTPRKVAEGLCKALVASRPSFLSATLDESGGPALVVDALDLEPGRYGRSFMVTVRDVDAPRPEDQLDQIRAYVTARLTSQHSDPAATATAEACRDILSILNGE